MLCAVLLLSGCASGPNWTRQAYSFSLPVDPPTANTPEDIISLSRVSISPLFQSRSFTYRTAENTYKQDPYAGFLISPERGLAESIRASMRANGVFGRVVEPGSGLLPNLAAEVFVNQLYGDFRDASHPSATMEIHFLCFEIKDGAPGKIMLDTVCQRETPLTHHTPAALMAGWDADLKGVMEQIESEYSKVRKKE